MANLDEPSKSEVNINLSDQQVSGLDQVTFCIKLHNTEQAKNDQWIN